MKKYLVAIIVPVLLAASCSVRDTKVEDAVLEQLALYPKSTLVDLYKAFYQSELGAEHMVSDTSSAGRYLDAELGTIDLSPVLYEPVGKDSAFFRVHLNAVQRGFISRNDLFEAFIGGMMHVERREVDQWKEDWKALESTIASMDLGIEGYDEDKASLDSLLSYGEYAVHHSRTFSEAYDPHYRIVRKDIFYSLLYDKLNR